MNLQCMVKFKLHAIKCIVWIITLVGIVAWLLVSGSVAWLLVSGSMSCTAINNMHGSPSAMCMFALVAAENLLHHAHLNMTLVHAVVCLPYSLFVGRGEDLLGYLLIYN